MEIWRVFGAFERLTIFVENRLRLACSNMAAVVVLCGCHVDGVFDSGLELMVRGLHMRLLV